MLAVYGQFFYTLYKETFVLYDYYGYLVEKNKRKGNESMTAYPDSALTHMLLYSPFSKDYHVDEKIAEKLTEEEFIEECYVEPRLNVDGHDIIEGKKDYIDEADDKHSFNNFETIRKETTVINNQEAYDGLVRWLNEHGNGVYCIKGDAGTGKSTFLHYMEYKHRNDKEVWAVVDLQDAICDMDIHSQRIKMNNFHNLDSKVISALLVNIFRIYFPTTRDLNVAIDNINNLYLAYLSRTDRPLVQSMPVRWFFEDADFFKLGIENTDIQAFSKHVVYICENIQNMIVNETGARAISYLIDIYLTLLRLRHPTAKHILAFDNIERFIGKDEIFNEQIGYFVHDLRNIQDSFVLEDPDYLKKCQYIVLMRNTTSRMITPIHSTSFGGHDLDLTGWFPADNVISKKMDWYEKNHFDIENREFINSIIGKESFDGHGQRSVQEKIGRLLNKDKRMIVNMLDRAYTIVKRSNVKNSILTSFQQIINNKKTLPKWDRLAARSIIIRMALDVLKEDDFFKYIRTMECKTETTEERNEWHAKLGYSRKILTIINNYDMNRAEHDSSYMPFDDIMRALKIDNHDNNQSKLMDTISQILFHMNYYNRRSNDWFRLIDIQYNLSDGALSIYTSNDLKNILVSNQSEKVGIKIVEAGKGYLEYIVQSFEYFSCRYLDDYLLPLFCLIPSLDDLENKRIIDMPCYRVIYTVRIEAEKCIKYMKENDPTAFPYRVSPDDRMGIPHINRVINAHQGYIGNFIGFLREYYKNDNLNKKQIDKLAELDRVIHVIHGAYEKDRI